MQTSDARIWAVGDAVETQDWVTGQARMVPLAGPANRQGRIAAAAIFGGVDRQPSFRGVQATSVVGLMGMTIAATGATETYLKQTGREGYEKVYLHPDHHAAYYPDAKTITIKLLFERQDGRILGAQAVGMEGVAKRIDVIATALQHNGTVFDLEEAELCYAPQYGSAKDPVNLAGMVAANILDGLAPVVQWEDLAASRATIVDVREPDEYAQGHVPGALNIPLHSLRGHLRELEGRGELWVHCHVGQRSYIAVRILRQKGFDAKNISGGYRMYLAFKACHGNRTS
jgi:rhodanese-related sulfurtransferase